MGNKIIRAWWHLSLQIVSGVCCFLWRVHNEPPLPSVAMTEKFPAKCQTTHPGLHLFCALLFILGTSSAHIHGIKVLEPSHFTLLSSRNRKKRFTVGKQRSLFSSPTNRLRSVLACLIYFHRAVAQELCEQESCFVSENAPITFDIFWVQRSLYFFKTTVRRKIKAL